MRWISVLMFSIVAQAAWSQTLPAFECTAPSGQTITSSDLVAGQPVIVMYFDPYCDHCETLAAEVSAAKEQFASINLVWITWEEMAALEAFQQKHFAGWSNTFVVKDENYMFDSWFGYSEVLSIYCYNSKWEATRSFTREQSVEVLLESVE